MNGPLIIGNHADEHTTAVRDALRSRSLAPVVIDAALLESQAYSFSSETLILYSSTGEPTTLTLGSPVRGWIRRLAPPHWRRGVVNGSEQGAVRGAWMTLLSAIAGTSEVSWLTPLERLLLRENKLLQMRTAETLNIPTPDTLVTSDRTLIPHELGGEMIVKPLGSADFSSPDGNQYVVWSQLIDRHSEALDLLSGAPFILQARLKAKRHLRVVTVLDSAWTCVLSNDGLPVDWRRNMTAHDSFVPASEPRIQERALRLAETLGVGYSSQDWIVTEDDAYFIDLNPAGQWLFLPSETANAITNAIADWLSG